MVVEGTKSLIFISLKQKNMLKSHGTCLKKGVPQHPVLHDYHKTLHFWGYTAVSDTQMWQSYHPTLEHPGIPSTTPGERTMMLDLPEPLGPMMEVNLSKGPAAAPQRVEKIHEIQPFNPCMYILWGSMFVLRGVVF
jgi:hypothetical protein